MMRWDIECDVVSVGSGAGGLSTAITAAEAGARALVLEKGPKLGGVTGFSLGQVWFGGTHLEAELGIEDSAAETTQYLEFLSAGLNDPEIRRSYVERGDEVVRFFNERAGLALEVIRGLPDYYYPKAPGTKSEGRYLEVAPIARAELGELADRVVISPHGNGYFMQADTVRAAGNITILGEAIAKHLAVDELCSGSGLSARLVKAAADRDVPLWTDSRVVRLIEADGAVVGVEVQTPDGPKTVRARGVMLATGGYDWNPALMRSYEHQTNLKSMAPQTIEGDHIVMATAVGAMVATLPTFTTPMAPGFHVPGVDWESGEPFYHGMFAGAPHTVMVNRTGNRFADESFFHDLDASFARFDGSNGEYPNRPAWFIFDANFREKYPLGPIMPGQPIPDGLVQTADTVGELADLLGVDRTNLENTVARFNQACAKGVDEEFGRGLVPWSQVSFGDARIKPNPLLGPLDKPPFHALQLTRLAASLPSAGLRTDPTGRVLRASGDPIPGLYAAGNAAARLDTGGYQSGTANARGLTFGYLAARDIVGS